MGFWVGPKQLAGLIAPFLCAKFAGVCAGADTATPALAAIQGAAKSAVPTLGYGVAYAVGNVLLALWGTVIVAMIA